ncbi:alpha 1,2-mannosyltransferase 2.4.1 [Mortierella polycephala]|uniref:Alpha 1,2-mannosyltransferase 2.4.1 n=1 Tax=Mortierella polycephala TaxID=41804 RepID=A0A9P6QDR5_9FUNG|nr:alpha 1,2-mannosyltransferase 2.4.1 [Mortierella polycephala]
MTVAAYCRQNAGKDRSFSGVSDETNGIRRGARASDINVLMPQGSYSPEHKSGAGHQQSFESMPEESALRATDEVIENNIPISIPTLNATFIPIPSLPNQQTRKANATFVMLVREKDLHGARSAVRQVEDRFNRHYQYPYVFLNDEPFTNGFMESMRTMSKSEMIFGLIPKEHWGYPDWISQEKAAEARRTMRKIIYGSSESYRHMCRYQSGFLVQHVAMLQFDYYWRIEPDVQYSCDIEFDPFLYMQDNNKKYGFTISLYEYPETIRSLWNATKEFMATFPHLLAKESALDFISTDGGNTYNYCHFWTNFEIVDARWMRGEAFQQYFQHLDRAGGFFYERWGDAPVHSIAAALLLSLDEIHFFREIGYFHLPFHNCPAEPKLQAKCHCDPALNARDKASRAKYCGNLGALGLVGFASEDEP